VPVGLGKGNFTTNLAIGTTALNANTADSYNTVIGYQAGRFTTSGYFNTFVGARAGTNLTTGNSNSAFGLDSLGTVSTGANNSAFGLNALGSIGTTSQNTAIGTSAGFLLPVSGYNSASANSVFIGYDTRPAADSQTNQIVIGHSAVGLGSNSVVLGNASITTTALRGNVGIGTTAPAVKLDVVGDSRVSAGSFNVDRTGGNFSAVIQMRARAAGDGSYFGSAVGNGAGEIISLGLSGLLIGSINAVPLVLGTNNLERLRIDSAGNVGIGTTAPSSKLHVASGAINIMQAGTNAGVPYIAVGDTAIYGDALDSLELRRPSSAAQTIKLYGTYTASPLAYERLTISAPSSGNAIIGTNKSGTGAVARGLEIQTDGVTRMTIATNGIVTIPVSIVVNSAVRTGFINNLSNSLSMFSFVDDSTGTSTYAAAASAPLMRFGGTTDSFPAIARDGAGIKFTGAAAGLTSWIKVPAVAVTSLPAAATAGVGARAFVNDALAPVFGSAVANGGSAKVPVYSDGSAWYVG
jgi:hypothetical protein